MAGTLSDAFNSKSSPRVAVDCLEQISFGKAVIYLRGVLEEAGIKVTQIGMNTPMLEVFGNLLPTGVVKIADRDGFVFRIDTDRGVSLPIYHVTGEQYRIGVGGRNFSIELVASQMGKNTDTMARMLHHMDKSAPAVRAAAEKRAMPFATVGGLRP